MATTNISTDTKSALKAIWKDTLELDSIDEKQGFLDAGGNSLNVVDIICKIQETWGVKVSPRLFFDNQTNSLQEIAREIDAQQKI